MPRLIAPLAATLLVFAGLAACGDDGGDTLSAEEFCEHLDEFDGMDEADDGDLAMDDDVDEIVGAIDELIPVAPKEVRDDLQVMRDKLAEFDELDIDEGDPEAGFEAFMTIVFDPEFLGAAERLEEFGVEECGFEPSDEAGDIGDLFDDDPPAAEVGDDPVPEAAMPDDVSLTRQPATLITWDEIDDAFDYRVEAGGRTLGTTFGGRFIALGDVNGDVVVEALEIGDESLGPAQGVRTESIDALVLEWTEEDGASYYVGAETADGDFFELTGSPYVFEVPADEVEAVRFGPAVRIAGDDGPRTDAPFDYGEQYYVELPLP